MSVKRWILYGTGTSTKQEEVKDMRELIRRFVREEEGQGMAEYGLILALIAVVCIAVFTGLGDAIIAKLNDVIKGLGGTTVQ